ncbi:hypothetical protein FS842_001705 [Serendipita sp. 407]|nr:hypothetical protein FS842_001705 [Serendipita sp. 407]
MSTRLSSKGSAASTPGSKLLSLRRSFGKLPRLSKELLYESIKQHPLPHSSAVGSSSTKSGSVPPKATVNTVLSTARGSDQVAACSKASAVDCISSTLTLSAQRPFESRPISVCHHQHNPNPMESMLDVPGGAASPPVSPLMLPAACCDSNLEVSVNPERTVKVARARAYKDGGINSESFFRDKGDDDVQPVNGWKQRGGLLYDALALPFRYSANKFRRTRCASDATTSTLDCESPVTPDGPSEGEALWNASAEDQAGCEYSPILDYDVPRDRFGRELSYGRKIMRHGSISRQSSADTIIGVPLPSSPVNVPWVLTILHSRWIGTPVCLLGWFQLAIIKRHNGSTTTVQSL